MRNGASDNHEEKKGSKESEQHFSAACNFP